MDLHTLAAEIAAVIGDALDESEFAALVDRVAAHRLAPALQPV